MSADPNTRGSDRRWTGWELAAILAAVWFLAILLYAILTATP